MTTSASEAIGDAKDHVEDAVREAGPALRALARLGLVAKGLVYTIVGVLALLAAFDRGGETTDQRGALRAILQQPFGRTMLTIAGVGLLGYALWRLIQALFDPEHVKHDAKGYGRRIARLVSGIAYASLGIAALRMVGGGGESGASNTQDWTATLMSQPAGPWLVGAVGLIVIGVGAWQIYRAWTAKLGDELILDRWSAPLRGWIIRFGRAGYAARGIIFCLVGAFMVAAANHENASEAKGVGEAMRHVQTMRYGWLMLAAIAIGLIAYGVFQWIEARYRRIQVS